MELTIEQTLQQGVAAHNEGNIQEAEYAYRAILRRQPKHPDANHNLGLIAITANQSDVALSLFKIALDVNPNFEQFWISYIDALVQSRQLEEAKRTIKKAKEHGFDDNKLQALLSRVNGTKNISPLSPPQYQLRDLLNCYNAGKMEETETLAIALTKKFPKDNYSWKILGAVYRTTGRDRESILANQMAVQLSPTDAKAHFNLGSILHEVDRFVDAEASYKQAIELEPHYVKAYSNLGVTLHELGRLEEAIAHHTQALALRSDYAEAHNNLGISLKEVGKLNEAEISHIQAIDLKYDYAAAHFNLGIVRHELGRLDEARASYTKAIAFKHDYAEAHINLGITLQELGRLEDAKANFLKVVGFKPDCADAHINLCRVFCQMGLLELALKSARNAKEIDPKSKKYNLIVKFLEIKRSLKVGEVAVDHGRVIGSPPELPSTHITLHRAVEPELISKLYEIKSTEKHKLRKDARFGTRSSDFNLFQDPSPTIQNVAKSLRTTLMEAFKSEIYIYDSFFNILTAGGGTTPHCHLNEFDKDLAFNLGKRKYSLQYYLSVGDQNCSKPGLLKLYDPEKDILPAQGLITIIPAARLHSAEYNGTTDRLMIGVNFYSI